MENNIIHNQDNIKDNKMYDENSMEVESEISSTEMTFMDKQITATEMQLQYVIDGAVNISCFMFSC